MNKPRLQIVRGLPGSGKSTFTHKSWPNLLKLEFDYYCMRGGEYAWGERRNAEGQKWLQQTVIAMLSQGFDFVVCGVFAGRSEHLPSIVRLAEAFGYDVYLHTLSGNFGNVHGVRDEDYQSMKNHFVSDEEIVQKMPGVTLGCMPTDYSVAPMKDGK